MSIATKDVIEHKVTPDDFWGLRVILNDGDIWEYFEFRYPKLEEFNCSVEGEVSMSSTLTMRMA